MKLLGLYENLSDFGRRSMILDQVVDMSQQEVRRKSPKCLIKSLNKESLKLFVSIEDPFPSKILKLIQPDGIENVK